MHTISIAGRPIGPGAPPYVIAEAGINHNGELDLARRMIREAAEIGVDAVKFQSFSAPGLMTEATGTAAHLEAGAGQEDVYSFVQRVSLDADAHRELADLCRESGIDFLSTPLEASAVTLLDELGVAAFKVASMDLDNLPLLRLIAEKGKPVILSTGMGTLGEVERALQTILAAGNDQVILLHCTSQYPPPADGINLRAIDTLAASFGVPVGYSDHTIGNAIPLAAVARGACLLEKHFTLDRAMPGPDQAISADPDDLGRLVGDARAVFEALGNGRKEPTAGERDMRQHFRRSIVAAEAVSEGAELTEELLTFKRPGSGISPCHLDWVIGRRARRAIAADEIIRLEDLG